MKDWFLGLQTQERITVTAGAVALAIMLFYVAVWDPIHSSVEQLEKNVAKQAPLLQWMQQAAEDVKNLKGTKSQLKSKAGQSLLSLVDSTAKSSKLGDALKRVKPDGEKKVRVWLENASFDAMVTWLEKMNKNYGIEVLTLVIDRKDVHGKIDARITFVGI